MSAGEERVLIFAPKGRDGSLLQTAISGLGFHAERREDAYRFLVEAERSNGVLVMTDEALTDNLISAIATIVDNQPPWSDLPILVMTGSGRVPYRSSAHSAKVLRLHGNTAMVDRPVRVNTLGSLINSALRSRRRQYQMRDHLRQSQENEEKYREAAKLEGIGVLAAGIAHDFNNLLTGIIGHASLGLEMVADDQDLRSSLSEIVNAGERAAELTSQILAYSGKGYFVMRPLDLSLLTDKIGTLAKHVVPANAELRWRLQGNLPLVNGDSGRLQQVIMNLIVNAGEAIPEEVEGIVTVSTGVRRFATGGLDKDIAADNPVAGDYVYLEVNDTGSGMTEEVKSRIFDPFFTTKFMGRGLGLAAVLGIVRSHNGVLRVASEVGTGSTISVFLPVAAVAREPQTQPVLADRVNVSATVLFADGDPSIRSLAMHLLPLHGMRVQVAADDRHAIDALKQCGADISLVVMDLKLPRFGGEQCYRALRSVSASVPVIISSGFPEAVLKERFADRGIAGFLKKPYTSERLVQTIYDVLAGRNIIGCNPGSPPRAVPRL